MIGVRRLPVIDVLKLRDFRLVFGAAMVSLLGDGIAPLAITFAVLDLTGSSTDLGLVLAALTIAWWARSSQVASSPIVLVAGG